MASSLVDGFLKLGLEARLVTGTSTNLRDNPMKDPLLSAAAGIDEYLLKAPSWDSLFSLMRDKKSVIRRDDLAGDLNIFRWMNGILGRKFLAGSPDFGNLVWGLDDMNPFTGGCHYSGACRGFSADCKRCPAVRPLFAGLVEQNLAKKLDFVDKHNPSFVAPTEWIMGQFAASRLGKDSQYRKIHNPLQSKFFTRPPIREKAGSNLRIVVVATNLDDPTKGVKKVSTSINKFMTEKKGKVTFIGRFSKGLASLMPGATFLGPLNTEAIIQQLRRNDALLVPSLFENAGTIVAEAASQGLGTIARNVGGMPEMTNYGETGLLFNNNSELDEILSSIRKTDLANLGGLALDWSQTLRPELIANKYAEAFL